MPLASKSKGIQMSVYLMKLFNFSQTLVPPHLAPSWSASSLWPREKPTPSWTLLLGKKNENKYKQLDSSLYSISFFLHKPIQLFLIFSWLIFLTFLTFTVYFIVLNWRHHSISQTIRSLIIMKIININCSWYLYAS